MIECKYGVDLFWHCILDGLRRRENGVWVVMHIEVILCREIHIPCTC
jgi:hypothetical protein